MFLDGSEAGWLQVPGIYIDSTKLNDAAKEFVKVWAFTLPKQSRSIIERPSLAVIDQLIKKHNLVMVVKLTRKGVLPEGLFEDEPLSTTIHDEESPIISPPPREPNIHTASETKPAVYRAINIDGLMTAQDVINKITDGDIRPETMIKIVGEKTRWKRASDYVEFQKALSDQAKGPQSGGLASSPTRLAKDLKGPVGQQYKYYSVSQYPHLVPRQTRHVEDVFGVQDSDQFYWFNDLRAPAFSGQITGAEFLRGKKTIKKP
jgi:hypothetical protein